MMGFGYAVGFPVKCKPVWVCKLPNAQLGFLRMSSLAMNCLGALWVRIQASISGLNAVAADAAAGAEGTCSTGTAWAPDELSGVFRFRRVKRLNWPVDTAFWGAALHS